MRITDFDSGIFQCAGSRMVSFPLKLDLAGSSKGTVGCITIRLFKTSIMYVCKVYGLVRSMLTASQGYPQEWFPSVSATIGDRYPERSFFQVFIAITSGMTSKRTVRWRC